MPEQDNFGGLKKHQFVLLFEGCLILITAEHTPKTLSEAESRGTSGGERSLAFERCGSPFAMLRSSREVPGRGGGRTWL